VVRLDLTPDAEEQQCTMYSVNNTVEASDCIDNARVPSDLRRQAGDIGRKLVAPASDRMQQSF